MTSKPPLLSVRGLHVHLPVRGRAGSTVRAVDDVDLDLRPGEILALAGESGCGKSTLARTLLGLQRPTAGTISLAGQPLRYSHRALRRHRRAVQLVPQDPAGALNPRHTVQQTVSEGLRIHRIGGDTDARIDAALANVGMRPPGRFRPAHPRELSGGQRQRVALAAALVLEPVVLVADEPLASLDPPCRAEILTLLLRLRRDLGLALVLITHDLAATWQVADRVAVMYLGRILEIGPTDRVLTTPRHPYTHALVQAAARRPTSGAPLPLEPPDAARIPLGCRFHPRCPTLHSGKAGAVDVVVRCRTEDPTLRTDGDGVRVACHHPIAVNALPRRADRSE